MTKRFLTTVPVIANSSDLFIQTSTYIEFLNYLKSRRHIHLIGGRQTGKTSTVLSAYRIMESEGNLCSYSSLAQHSDKITMKELLVDLFEELEINHAIKPGTLALDITKKTIFALQKTLRSLATLPKAGKRFFLFIDELDVLMKFRPKERFEFLSALRTFATSIEAKDRVTLVTASVLRPEELGRLGSQPGYSQVTFGIVLPLEGFDIHPKTVKQLKLGFKPKDHSELDDKLYSLLEWTNGHPQLTMTFCDTLVYHLRQGNSINQAFETSRREMHNRASNHLDVLKEQLRTMGDLMPPILHLFEEISRAEVRAEPKKYEHISFNLTYLESLGLVRRDDYLKYYVANDFYRKYLDQTWVNDLLTQHYNILMGKRRSSDNDNRASILVILTGGTLGMRIEDGQAVFRSNWVKDIIAKDLECVAKVDIEFLDFKDGINMHPQNWEQILNIIQRFRQKGWVDAVVVGHGTDTLVYSACGVAFAYGQGLDFPIIFTGSQCTLDAVHGDARTNIIRACRVAVESAEKKISEVMICFNDKVFKACRAQKTHDHHFDGFASPTWPILAQISEVINFNPNALRRSQSTPQRPKVLYSNNILYINIIPGLKEAVFSQILDLEPQIDGVILATPGAGNIPSKGVYNFQAFISKAISKYIPVLINSQMPIDPDLYQTYEAANKAVKSGATFAGNMTQAAALTKFSWAIKHSKELDFRREQLLNKVQVIMKTNLIDEVGEFGSQTTSALSQDPHPIPKLIPSGVEGPTKVAVIMTGGTIGMIHSEGINQFVMDAIEEFVKPELRPVAKMIFDHYGPRDGIDMNHEDWNILIKKVKKHREEGAKAIVITHGTDTMAFTASALAFALGPGLDFPIVFTGAQTTTDRLHGDSRINITRAVYVAVQTSKKEGTIPEVMICFNDRVYRAVRSEKIHDQDFRGFASPGWPFLAQITDSLKVNWSAVRKIHQTSHAFNGFAENILFINIVPGLKVETYNQFLHFQNSVDGVILATPGVGNIPNEGEYNFHHFLRLAKKRGIPVLITSQVPVSPPIDYHYRAAREPIDSFSAIYAGNMTTAAAFTKFSWAIALEKERSNAADARLAVEKRMSESMIGETNVISDQE